MEHLSQAVTQSYTIHSARFPRFNDANIESIFSNPLFMAAPFDQREQKKNTGCLAHHLIHGFMLKKDVYDMYGSCLETLGVFTKLHMECKQIQVINPLSVVHRVEEDEETLDDQYGDGSDPTVSKPQLLDCDHKKQVTTNGFVSKDLSLLQTKCSSD